MHDSGLIRKPNGGHGLEQARVQKPEILAARARDAVVSPFADRRATHLADLRDGHRAAKRVDYFGIRKRAGASVGAHFGLRVRIHAAQSRRPGQIRQ